MCLCDSLCVYSHCGEYLLAIIHYSVFFQAEDVIRDAQESRGLGDVYKIQYPYLHIS